MKAPSRLGLTLALVAGLVTACADEPTADGRAAEAVAAAPPPMAPYASLSVVETLRDAGEMPFGYVGEAVAGPDGAVYVADYQTRTIARYDRSGRFMATIGAQGRGPGEFEAIAALAFSGDTIFVWDPVVWRISAFDRNGVLLMAERVEPRRLSGWPTNVARLGDGTWLYLDQDIATPTDPDATIENGIIRANADLVRWSPSDDRWTPVASVPGMQAGLYADAQGDPALVEAPYPRGPLWTLDGAGGYWYADNGAYVVTRFSLAGDTIGRIVVGMTGPAVTDADRRAYLTAGGTLDPSDPQSRLRSELPIPESRPVLLDLLTTREGNLWVSVDAGVPDSIDWHAFGPDQRLAFRLRLPATSSVLSVSGDTALVVTRDALDVQTVGLAIIR